MPSGGLDLAALVEMLELPLDGVERGRVEQFAQFRVAKQFPELALIDRERLRPPFGQRGIAVVDVVGDIAEEQRRRERGRRVRIDRRDAHVLFRDPAKEVNERGKVEMVPQHLAIGFEQRGKRPES